MGGYKFWAKQRWMLTILVKENSVNTLMNNWKPLGNHMKGKMM